MAPAFVFCVAFLLASTGMALLNTGKAFLHDVDEDVLLRLRGRRHLSADILLVAIDESDVKALGGWPITRDYYGYLIHVLTEKHAGVIGLDVLLDTPGRQYPEYDRMLAEFIQTSGRVVLPSVLDASRPTDSLAQANPLPEFAWGAAGVGFSNLGDEVTIRRVPLVMKSGDGMRVSFGLALAQAWLGAQVRMDKGHVVLVSSKKSPIRVPVNREGCMLLNPAGDVSSIRSIRLTTLLHQYESAPDSLDFSNRLVLMAATAPSLPVLKSTPLCPQLPASLIQATVAENILNRNWLKYSPFLFTCIWFMGWMCLAYAVSSAGRIRHWIFWIIAAVSAILGLSLGCLVLLRVVMPLFSCMLLFLISAMVTRTMSRGRKKQTDLYRMVDIENQILVKEKALAEAEQRLTGIEIQLAIEKAENQQLSEASRRLAEEKETAVLDLEKQVRDLKASFEPEGEHEQPWFHDIIHGSDSPMVDVLRMVGKVAKDDIPVLIQGETGTGKELIARAIHRSSPRHHNPFVAVNCGALSESLLESELFGHEKGAFTGAQNQRRGRFELAQGGTLFLDEIAETTPAFQARLLRVLQEGTFERVGGERTLQADVRIIAAHNKDLTLAVQEKQFRQDLYFRLNGFPIHVPQLRNRPGDIPALVRFFLEKYHRGSEMQISDAGMVRLQSFRWPGNVRELENAVRRAVLLARSDGRRMVQLKDLPEEIQKADTGTEPVLYHPLETQILETLQVLQFSRSAIGQTAKALGNRDRGTVTEYFRGLCFQFLVQHQGDVQKAASALAGSDDPETIARVKAKIVDYVENVRISLAEKPFLDYTKPACFKGLPQKFHPFLQQLIDTIL